MDNVSKEVINFINEEIKKLSEGILINKNIDNLHVEYFMKWVRGSNELYISNISVSESSVHQSNLAERFLVQEVFAHNSDFMTNFIRSTSDYKKFKNKVKSVESLIDLVKDKIGQDRTNELFDFPVVYQEPKGFNYNSITVDNTNY